jgi:nickel-dependent lactate racemase
MEIEIDEGRPVEIVLPKDTPAQGSIAATLSHPINFEDLEPFIAQRRKILVVMNDHTRPTPSLEVFKHLNLKGKDVTTIVAPGTHRSPYPHELTGLLGGSTPPYGGRVVIHNSKDMASLKAIGQTSRGTKLLFNSHLFEADGIIVIGSVEPHYFAGYTGGRKFLLPALAGFQSVEMNHSLALDERARILSLDGNPVHEDFMEALDIFDRYDDIFSIQLAVNAKHEIGFSSSGHIVQSFMEAVKRAKEMYVAPVQTKADIVISVAKPPMDVDLYQSQKSFDNVKLALNEGGVLILVSRCTDGIGDRGFFDILASGEDVLKKAKENYKFGYHKAVKITELLNKAHVFAVTDLPQELLKSISITPYRNVQTALEDATKLMGRESKILIVQDSGITVPVPKSSLT